MVVFCSYFFKINPYELQYWLVEGLIQRYHVILKGISTGHEIYKNKFKIYTKNDENTCLPSFTIQMLILVHKLLITRLQITDSALLPVGQMPEEA